MRERHVSDGDMEITDRRNRAGIGEADRTQNEALLHETCQKEDPILNTLFNGSQLH